MKKKNKITYTKQEELRTIKNQKRIALHFITKYAKQLDILKEQEREIKNGGRPNT